MTGQPKRAAPRRDSCCTVRRAATLVPVPWKNGGGTTSELAIWPHAASFDDFVWRVSIAEIARDGAFSDFPGVDRTIVLLDGAGMALEGGPDVSAPERHVLRAPYLPLAFDGGTRWHARLVDGPTHDFNLMVRRGAARGALTVWRGTGTFALPAACVLLFVAHGTATLRESGVVPPHARELGRHDSVQPGAARDPACSVTLDAGAVVLVVTITAADAAAPGVLRQPTHAVADTGMHTVGAASAATAS